MANAPRHHRVHSLRDRAGAYVPGRAGHRRRTAALVRVESLEDRVVPANFTAGNIAVLDLASTSTNTAGSILELSPSTASQTSPVQTISIASTGASALRFSDSGTSGFLSDSNDGTQLVLAAYNTTDSTTSDLATTGTSLTSGTDPDDRAVATLGNSGNLTIPTHYVDSTSGNQARSATTLDDSTYVITDKGGLFTNGATTASLTTNILDARSFGGTVYVSSTKAAAGVSTVASPTATSLTGLPGLPADGSIQDFYLIPSGSNGSTYDVLYTLDQNSSNATINKFSLVAGTWVANGTFTLASNATSMIAENNGSGAYLYVVTTKQSANNSVVRLTDSTGWVNSATPSAGFTLTNNTTLYTDTAGDTLKGIAFAPVASPTTPTVSAPTSANVGIHSATLGGTVTSTGSPGVISYGIVYSLASVNSNPTIGGTGVTQLPATGSPVFSPFNVSATGLQQTAQYAFAAYVTNSAGTSYSSVQTFNTQNANPPTIDTPADTAITSTSATLGGTVESDGGSTVTRTGVVYALTSANANPQIGGTGVSQVDTTSPVDSGAFTVTATSLSPGAQYTFEAFATNSSGTTYTAATSFTTLAPPTVKTPTFTDVTSSSAVLGGNIASNGGSSITKWGVVYALTSANGSPQIGGPGVTEADASGTPSGAFAVPISGLSAATGYTFEAFATNGTGTTYTQATSFNTAAPGVIAAWTFPTTAGAPDNSPAPTYGSGTATTLGMTNSLTNDNGTGNTASDDVLATSGTADPNFTENLWRVRGTPNNGWALSAPEYSQGIELDTSTVGYSNIVFAFDWYSTTQGVRDLQVQYNTGSGWVNYQGPSPTGTFVATSNDYYNAALSPVNPTIEVNLSNVPAANNNPDLGIRLVSAYDSTGTLGNVYASATSTPGNVVPYNNSSGNWRFGNLAFYGNLATTTTALTASPAGTQAHGQNVTFIATVTPASGSAYPSGTVNFYDGNSLIGSQSVTQVGTTNVGTAVLTLDTLSPGVHGDITAQYIPATTSGMIASGSSMNLTTGDPTDNPISYVISAPQATGVDVSPVSGQSFTGVVATFSDGVDTDPAGFTATIDWGDGHTSTGTIAFSSSINETNIDGQVVNVQLFTVTGTNTYTAAGNYPLSVTITDPANNSTTVTPNARVAYAPLKVTGAATINAVANLPLTNATVASFTDPGLVANLTALGITDPTTQFSATINWGDGSAVVPGTIRYDATSQVFSVTGTHTYAQTGPYSISVAVTPLTVSVERTDSSDPTDLNEVGDENGDGLTDSPSPDFIDQFVIGAANQTGSVYTFSLPTVSTTSGNEALTNSSYSRSEGELSLSTNGQYLVLGGYNSTVDLWGPQSTYSDASMVNRVIGTIDGQGDINTATALTDTYSGDNFRGVVSTDGTQFWTAGHSGDNSDYVHYAQLGASTSTIITGPNDPNNINSVEIFNGQLYEGVRKVASDAPAGIYQIGTGLPTSAGQSQTMFIEVPQSNPLDVTDSDNPTGPVGFWMTDLPDGNPSINGVKVAYVADAEMGIARYDYTASGWQFSYYINSTGSFLNSAYTVDGNGNVTATSAFNPNDPAASGDPTKAGGVRELTGRVVNGQVQLFAVTGFGTGSEPTPGNSLIEVTDTGANASYSVLATDTTGLSTNPGASVFTGVAFTPTQTVSSSAVVDAITSNPRNQTIYVGQNASFNAATANPAGTDTVRWQVSTDGGKTFTPLSDSSLYSGSATTTLTITSAPRSLNGTEYEAVFTTGVGTLTTTPATLAVNPAPTSVTLTSSANPVVLEQSVKFTATVANASGTTLLPVGSVAFFETTSNTTISLGTVVLPAGSNQATLTTLFATAGSYRITASYADTVDSNFAASTTALTETALAPGVTPFGTTLYLIGGNTNDNVTITTPPAGPGLTVSATLNGVHVATTYTQTFTAIVFYGYQGNDQITLGNGVNLPTTVIAGNGNDQVHLGNGANSVTLGNGNDQVEVGIGNNTIIAGYGNDQVQATGSGNDQVELGDGNDQVELGNGDNTVTVGSGNDQVELGNGNNTATVGNGNDQVKLGNGDNVIVEGSGHDEVQAGNGNNFVAAGLGQHTIQLGNGNNILIDGAVTLSGSVPGDSFRAILAAWNSGTSAASLYPRLKVVFNTSKGVNLTAGSGRDWFIFANTNDSTNAKSTDTVTM